MDGSFDIDVVGLTDLSPFTPDSDLFEFDSQGDYSLFGEDGAQLQQSSSLSLLAPDGRDDQPTCNDFSLQPKNSKPRQRKCKEWNEIEKDLFQKGLEMFEYNWRKISKFVGTKTAYQVKIYYKKWSETGNVIHESENLISDSCIYISQASDYDGYLNLNDTSLVSYKDVTSSVDVKTEDSQEYNTNESVPSNNHDCGSELVVSSLNDWNLGSQVSVVNEVHEIVVDSSDKEVEIYENNYSPPKKKKVKRKIAPFVDEKNIIGMAKPHVNIDQGQIVHLTKVDIDDEDSEIDIDGIDQKEDVAFKCSFNGTISDNLLKGTYLLTYAEKELCSSLWPTMNCDSKFGKFIDIKNSIVDCWKSNNYNCIHLTSAMNSLRHIEESRGTICRIFDILEKNGWINSPIGRNEMRTKKRSRRQIGERKEAEDFDGGITTSHDESGAVIDSLRIAAKDSTKMKKSDLKLNKYMRHGPNMPAPYAPMIDPLALITLDTHAHSSQNEVMGLLGGFFDRSGKTLYINMVVPTKSTSSGIACDMCPMAQLAAVQMIDKEDSQVVGWYHSHPTFLPIPSSRDLVTQCEMQKLFNRNHAPFVGIIISPFYFTSGYDSSLIRCMVLDRLLSSSSSPRSDAPFSLPWSINENSPADSESNIGQLIDSIPVPTQSLHWQSEYKDGRTFANKLTSSLQLHLPKQFHSLISKVLRGILES